jgi:hypothetical protein
MEWLGIGSLTPAGQQHIHCSLRALQQESGNALPFGIGSQMMAQVMGL